MKRGLILFITFITPILSAVHCRQAPPEEFTAPNLSIMTINVWSGLDYIGTLKMGEYELAGRREMRYRALVNEIKTQKPDIIGINEANFLPDYAERLADDLNYDYIYHVGVAGLHIGRVGLPANLKEGDALLARRELQLKWVGRKQLSGGGFIWNNFSFHLEDATQVVVGRVTVGDKNIFVAITHIHASPPDIAWSRRLLSTLKDRHGYSNEELKEAISELEADNKWRKDETILLAEYLAEVVPDSAKVILMGDFNAEIDTPEMITITGAGYTDTFTSSARNPGYTWDPPANRNILTYYVSDPNKKHDSLYDHLKQYDEMNRWRIDFILTKGFPKECSVLESRVCCNTLYKGVHPSDHFGVFTRLSVK